ncbi:MAG TPA: trehalose-phosphatase [Angustibacter sp.]|nr:trehalose-phosphatase [Angustibacter sp.]
MSEQAERQARTAAETVAAQRPLLIGLDFDGVLAPIVERPGDARALPGTLDAVRDLAAVPDVTVVLVSGRARDDLLELTSLDPHGDVLVIGSHGAERPRWPREGDVDDPPALDDAARARLSQVQARLEGLAAEHPGAHVEHKPTAAVLHTRRLVSGESETVAAQALALLAQVPGVHVTRGKEVVEAAVVEASKGAALAWLRDQVGARSLIYLGDDVTDETVFRSLRDGDLGIKVGDGDTAAAERLADPEAVRDLLHHLAHHLTAPSGR